MEPYQVAIGVQVLDPGTHSFRLASLAPGLSSAIPVQRLFQQSRTPMKQTQALVGSPATSHEQKSVRAAEY